MYKDDYGQLIFDNKDLCNLIMQGKDLENLKSVIVDNSVDLNNIINFTNSAIDFIEYKESDKTVPEFDEECQSNWYMPDEYKNLDIAEYVLSLCNSQEELQRCGHELLLFQQKNLFELLCYLKYLVDIMKENNIIWGIGRGSSVASYVLYKLGVHGIDSMYYDLEPEEFLR